MTVARLGREMGSREYSEWIALATIEAAEMKEAHLERVRGTAKASEDAKPLGRRR